MKKIMNKTTAIVTALFLMLSCSTAFAGTQTDTISYNGHEADCTLKTTWYFSDPDKAKARTKWDGYNGYVVTVGLSAYDDNGNRMAGGTDYGAHWGEVNISKRGVDVFYSTHTIAQNNNVWQALALTDMSDD
jgi:hypothetical protein